MNQNAIRTAHPSSAQVEALVEFMERNPGLAKGFLPTQNARERGRRQWEELAVRLNSLGGTIKNYKQWTKDEIELSELEERIVALCGGEGFSTGDLHLGIQPFPGPEQTGNSQYNRDGNTVARRLFLLEQAKAFYIIPS
ncbi:hypothetical protein evm_000250 [Chilo suppressalis]|nr:hypothetical protein evm_000250 [Chilo suppressalis]